MKTLNHKPQMHALMLALTVLAFTSCTDRFPSSYTLELPLVPAAWVSILGQPHWRVEWVDTGGQKQIADYPVSTGIEIEIPVTWTNPVTAWPYWPAHNLIPGIFKPCGALFPFDANGDRLLLSWEAGVDAVFYQELALAYSQNNVQNTTRTPVNFDWPRFRELFKTDALSEAVREDPWIVNWNNVAERTITSNFDRRRIVPEAVELKSFTVPGTFWYGASPFVKPLFFEDGEQPVFPVRQGFNVWVSSEGMLRVNGNSWVFTENPSHKENYIWQK